MGGSENVLVCHHSVNENVRFPQVHSLYLIWIKDNRNIGGLLCPGWHYHVEVDCRKERSRRDSTAWVSGVRSPIGEVWLLHCVKKNRLNAACYLSSRSFTNICDGCFESNFLFFGQFWRTWNYAEICPKIGMAGNLHLRKGVCRSSCGALSSFGTNSRVFSGYFHLAKLPRGDASIDGGSEEGEKCNNRKRHLYGELAVIAGALLALYCFWYLQFRIEDLRPLFVILPLLVGCFLLIMYGTYLFLDSQEACTDSLTQRSQLSQDALGKQNELSGVSHALILVCCCPPQTNTSSVEPVNYFNGSPANCFERPHYILGVISVLFGLALFFVALGGFGRFWGGPPLLQVTIGLILSGIGIGLVYQGFGLIEFNVYPCPVSTLVT